MPDVPRRPAVPPFDRLVYRLVRRIPRGRVMTYGQVAAAVGRPRAARAVGRALAALRGPLAHVVPWHRVVNAAGRCSLRKGEWDGTQRERLEMEGVHFGRRGRVDLDRFAWNGPRGRRRDRPS